MDFVDVYYCHESDPDTPIAEMVDAMSEIVSSGRARYWAVSNWKADEFQAACVHAKRYGRHRPIVNQVEYNILHRITAERLRDVLTAQGAGLVVWGPLAGGLLSGKYLQGVPEKSRAKILPAGMGIAERLVDGERNQLVAALAEVAADIGCSVGQLALAWTMTRPTVSSVLTFSSDLHQFEESIRSVEIVEKMSDDVARRIASVVGDYDLSNIPLELQKG